MPTENNVETDIKLYSLNQVASICGVTRTTVKDWISKGHIKPIRLGTKLLRVTHEELTRFLTQ